MGALQGGDAPRSGENGNGSNALLRTRPQYSRPLTLLAEVWPRISRQAGPPWGSDPYGGADGAGPKVGSSAGRPGTTT